MTARPLLMDSKLVAVVPSEWDLDSTAAEMTTADAATETDYAQFCETYGTSPPMYEGYEFLVGDRELRMTTYTAPHASMRPEWQAEAQYRVNCLRGRAEP
ncbi:hypothetical protein ACIQMR_31170 [Streptomyces sp. NPDC091376]|uniref:hypothetical protein n=1 Tax=Streptomyces sp. NPDC091376 TaxID=3365994 RepID=UPI0037F27FFF